MYPVIARAERHLRTDGRICWCSAGGARVPHDVVGDLDRPETRCVDSYALRHGLRNLIAAYADFASTRAEDPRRLVGAAQGERWILRGLKSEARGVEASVIPDGYPLDVYA